MQNCVFQDIAAFFRIVQRFSGFYCVFLILQRFSGFGVGIDAQSVFSLFWGYFCDSVLAFVDLVVVYPCRPG